MNIIEQHIINLQSAADGVKRLPARSRAISLAVTHLDEARHLLRASLVYLDYEYNVEGDIIRDVEPCEQHTHVDELRDYLLIESQLLAQTALKPFEYSRDEKDKVLYVQHLFTTARVHVTQAIEWIDDIRHGKV